MSSLAVFEEVAAAPSDINEHLPTFVDLCIRTDAQKVIELGVRSGVSTIGWLYGLEQTGGHLWSVDIDGKPRLTADHWTFVQGDDMSPDTLAQLPDVVDIVFVDTSHMYQHTCDEIAAYKSRVRPGGCMVFHDVAVEVFGHLQEEPWPVRRAVKEWVRRDDLRSDWWANNNGLAVVWMPDA